MSTGCCDRPDPLTSGCTEACPSFTNSCTDLTSIVIQAILNLGEASGSLATDIWAEVDSLCSTEAFSQTEVDTALSDGAREGRFRRIFASSSDTPTFMVNARMSDFNYAANSSYNRLPCQTDSFWSAS